MSELPTTDPALNTSNSHDTVPESASNSEPSGVAALRMASRSVTLWIFFLITIAALAGLVFMAFHPHPVDSGKVRGPGDEAAPNAPPDYKHP
jgi:hypothetical protein